MPYRLLCRAKIHRATVTAVDRDYVGSIAIDEELMERVDLWPGEQVHVWDVDNGERFVTYAVPASRGSGAVIVNGAAAHRVRVGDRVIIAAFVLAEEPVAPRMILVDEANRFVRELT